MLLCLTDDYHTCVTRVRACGEMMGGVGKSSPWQMVALVSVILQEMVLGKDHAALLKGFVATQRSTASVGHVLTIAR